jgi:hypothetical protein
MIYEHPWKTGSGPALPTLPEEVLLAGEKSGTVEVAEEKFPANVSIADGTSEVVLLRDLLFLAGLMGTPASQGSFGAWGNLLSHYEHLSLDGGEWRLCEEAANWDSTAKGHLMYRLGMGLAGWMLWQHYGVVHIADAEPFIGGALADAPKEFAGRWLKSLKQYGEQGGYKPDLFCLNADDEVVIAEPKGREGPPSVVDGDKVKGKKQVSNVTPVGVPLAGSLSRLVFATSLRIEGQKTGAGKGSRIAVVDPDEEEGALPVPVSKERIMLSGYTRLFRHVGQLGLARMLEFLGEGILDEQELREEIDAPLLDVPQLLLADLGGILVGLEAGVAMALLTSGDGRDRSGVFEAVKKATATIEQRIDGVWRNRRRTILPNGVVIGSRVEVFRDLI